VKADLGPEQDRLMRALVELRGQQIGSTEDSARSYDALHTGESLRQKDSFYIWTLSLLGAGREQIQGRRLLDVSCGQGSLLDFAHQAGLAAVGFDLSASALTRAVQRLAGRAPEAMLSQADAQQLPFADGSFDFVTNIGSLEHYFRPDLAVRETARVLVPQGGRALFLLPNTFGLLGNVLHVWRTGDVHDDGQPLQRYGTNSQWRKLLELNGLQIVETVRYERVWPRTRGDLLWYARRPHKLGRVLLAPLIPTNLSSFLIYLCQRAP
jgi:ubiquinone/menaquinone biosynthesis C-methylase UbiE